MSIRALNRSFRLFFVTLIPALCIPLTTLYVYVLIHLCSHTLWLAERSQEVIQLTRRSDDVFGN